MLRAMYMLYVYVCILYIHKVIFSRKYKLNTLYFKGFGVYFYIRNNNNRLRISGLCTVWRRRAKVQRSVLFILSVVFI